MVHMSISMTNYIYQPERFKRSGIEGTALIVRKTTTI